MRIEKINNYNILKLQNNKRCQKNILNKKCTDTVFFMGNDKKPKQGIFTKLVNKFSKNHIAEIACYMPREDRTNLTPEEEKSEEIKNFIANTINSYDFLQERGKSVYKELSIILAQGAKQNYKGTIVYNSEDNTNVTFSEINPDTKVPYEAIIWKNGQYYYSYKIEEKEPQLKYTIEVPDKNVNTTHNAVGIHINSFTQLDTKNSKVKQLDLTETGFNYLYGRTFDDTQDVEIIKRLYFDFNDINGCIYAEGTDEGIALFMYDHSKDLWEQTHIITFEENE